MPAAEPWARVIAGREEGELQRREPLRLGRRRIGAGADRGAHVGRARVLADVGGDERHRTHDIGTDGGEQPRHAVAERVPDHEGRAVRRMLDHRRDVVRIVVQVDAAHPASASPDAARLRPQHAKPGDRHARRDRVEILRAAPERRQQHDQQAFALREDFDLRVAAMDDRPSNRHGSPLPASGERGAGTEQAACHFFAPFSTYRPSSPRPSRPSPYSLSSVSNISRPSRVPVAAISSR